MGLFGGSFDPVHQGHLTVVRAVLGQDAVDHLLVVPARVSPHKLETPPTPPEARLDLLQAAFETLPEDHRERLSIWTAELFRSGPSFTLDTVRALAAARGHRAAPPRLVVGQDSVAGLPRWREVEALLDSVELLVVERGGATPLARLLRDLEAAGRGSIADRVRAGWLPLEGPSAASSTALRERLPGAPAADEDLPPGVLERIRRRGLYGRPAGPSDRSEPESDA